MKENLTDIEDLLDGLSSSTEESFRVLEKTANYRIGVGVRRTSDPCPLFLEVVVSQCIEAPKLDLSIFRKNLQFLEALRDRGYSLDCQGNDICCEMEVRRGDLKAECEELQSIAGRIYQNISE